MDNDNKGLKPRTLSKVLITQTGSGIPTHHLLIRTQTKIMTFFRRECTYLAESGLQDLDEQLGRDGPEFDMVYSQY